MSFKNIQKLRRPKETSYNRINVTKYNMRAQKHKKWEKRQNKLINI